MACVDASDRRAWSTLPPLEQQKTLPPGRGKGIDVLNDRRIYQAQNGLYALVRLRIVERTRRLLALLGVPVWKFLPLRRFIREF